MGPMRKGVSDFWRSFRVGIAAKRRYLDDLGAALLKGEGVAALDALCRPHSKAGRTSARSSRSPRPTWPCSTLVSGSMASTASGTVTSPHASTGGRHTTPTKRSDDGSESHVSSSSCEDTDLSPKSHEHSFTESPHTATESSPPQLPSTTMRTIPPPSVRTMPRTTMRTFPPMTTPITSHMMSGIPQGGGGDRDGDNFGGPDDHDGGT